MILTRIVTVRILYYNPDYRSILNEFVWQTADVVPELFRVHRFLNYWKDQIEAAVEEVTVSYPGPRETVVQPLILSPRQ